MVATCKPVTVTLVDVEVAMTPPGDAVTVYDVIGEPPLNGADQLTVAWRFCAVAVTDCGAPGIVCHTQVPLTAVLPLLPSTSTRLPSPPVANPKESRADGACADVSFVQVVAPNVQVSLFSALPRPPKRTI